MVKAILHSHESKTLFLFKIKFDMYHIFTTINLKRLQKKPHYWDFCNPASTSHHYSSKPLFLSCFWVLWRLRFHTFSEFEAENLNFSYFFSFPLLDIYFMLPAQIKVIHKLFQLHIISPLTVLLTAIKVYFKRHILWSFFSAF